MTADTPVAAPALPSAWDCATALLQEPLATSIRAKAKKLARRFPFRSQDWQDIEQALLLKAIQVWPNIDPVKGDPEAFLGRVLGNEASNLRRHRKSQRRQPHAKVLSLQRECRNSRTGESAELGALVTTRELQARLGIATPTDHQRLETCYDVRQVLGTLPPEACVLLTALMDATKAEVARRHRVQRTTLNSRLRRLRPRFEGA